MRNTKNYFIAITCLSILACKKNSAKEPETPLQSLVYTNFLDSLRVVNPGSLEIGYSFLTTQDGHITKFGCHMPNKGTYRVALWDNDSKMYKDTALINVTDSTKFNYVDIKPIQIIANKIYVISINNTFGGIAKEYFVAGKKPNVTFDLPIFYKSTIIAAMRYIETSELTFPNKISIRGTINGIPDFVFVPD